MTPTARPLVGLVCLALGLGLAACSRRPAPPRHVLLISIDTCRADHLSVYGYPRPTSPFLQELARRGVLFTRAFAQVPDTTPSHASMLTSRYPFVHGAANGVPLGEEFVTLAEVLREGQFRTAAFVSGWTMNSRDSGLSQGFETYDDELDHRGWQHVDRPNERRAEHTASRALEWLDVAGDERFFLFLHFFDPHGQYQPPPPYDTMFPPTGTGEFEIPLERIPPYARIGDETDAAVYISKYDGEIRYVDDQIRRVLDALDGRRILEDTLVVVTADHGESLTEHGFFFAHGWRLFEPSIRVPLLMSLPGRLPTDRRFEGIVQSIDLMPTILDILEIEPPQPIDGISVLPALEGRPGPANPFSVSKTTKTLTYLAVALERELTDHYAIRTENWKYLHSENGRDRMLFDLLRDPLELRNVIRGEPDRAAELRQLLAELLTEKQVDVSKFLQPLDEDERRRLEERLRSLGYLR